MLIFFAVVVTSSFFLFFSFVRDIRYAHDFQVDAPWCTKCRRPPEHITAAPAEQQLCSVSSERPPPAFYSFLESIAVNPPRNPMAFYKDGIKSNATSAIITAPIPTRASQAFDLKGWLDPLHPRLGDYEYGTVDIVRTRRGCHKFVFYKLVVLASFLEQTLILTTKLIRVICKY